MWCASWRFVRMLVHALRGIATVLWRFPSLTQAERQQRVNQWAQGMVARTGMRLEVFGQPIAQGPALLVSNHISWLDIPVLHASRFCRFVSKDEVRNWPLIGRLADAAQTLYITRSSLRDTQRMVQTMAESLRHGDVVAVFPEGTTSHGLGLLPFHANLLQAAIEADAPIQPVALRFVIEPGGQMTTAPSFVGEDHLLTSIWRTLRTKGLVVQVHFGVPQYAQGRDRRTWCADLQAQVQALRESDSNACPQPTPL